MGGIYYKGVKYGDTGSSGGSSSTSKAYITLGLAWNAAADVYSQQVQLSGYTVTQNSKVDLQPDAQNIADLANDNVVALYIANNNGTLTAYAIGNHPSKSMTIQCTITELAE